MRVITGSARGRRLKELEGLETRPTTGKVKESLFSIIQFDIEGRRVLDLFAGTGQLGIEALSRGAAECVFIDRRADAVKLIRENLALCRLEDRARVRQGEALPYLRSGEKFDIVFADPPYALEGLETIPDKVFSAGILHPGCYFILEHGDEHSFADHPCFKKEKKYGRVHFSFFSKDEE